MLLKQQSSHIAEEHGIRVGGSFYLIFQYLLLYGRNIGVVGNDFEKQEMKCNTFNYVLHFM